jgi:hypothetical protein
VYDISTGTVKPRNVFKSVPMPKLIEELLDARGKRELRLTDEEIDADLIDRLEQEDVDEDDILEVCAIMDEDDDAPTAEATAMEEGAAENEGLCDMD